MVLCVPPVARMPKLCCGTSMMANTCTPWTTPTQSTHFASRLTAIGCAPPPAHLSRFGIWKAKTWLKSSNQRSLETLPRLDHPNVCLWLGQLMAKLFSLVTLTTKSVSGRFPSPLPAKQIRTIIGHCAMRYFDDMLKVISSFLCW